MHGGFSRFLTLDLPEVYSVEIVSSIQSQYIEGHNLLITTYQTELEKADLSSLHQEQLWHR